MIIYRQGNLFDTDTDAIVNTVNCVGVMGRGVALQFKKRFPDNFAYYAEACKRHEVVPGKMLVFATQNIMPPRYIINFPTKRHWRGCSRLEDIESGLYSLAEVIKQLKIRSIALPPLGCGLGGLNWKIVKGIIESILSSLSDITIEVFEPSENPLKNETIRNLEPPCMTEGRAALILLVQQYLKGLLDPFVTLLEIHKLMYFLQECGQPLRLEFVKALYGPYAANLRHVLNRIEGYYISGYADGGDNPQKELKILPSAVTEAQNFVRNSPDAIRRIEQVSNLVEGFESPFGLELLATIHWLVKHENIQTLENLVQATYAWNAHKRQFSPRQIELAAARLMTQGWLKISTGTKEDMH